MLGNSQKLFRAGRSLGWHRLMHRDTGTQKGDGVDQSLPKLSTLWDLGTLCSQSTHPLKLSQLPAQG